MMHYTRFINKKRKIMSVPIITPGEANDDRNWDVS